MCGIAAAFNVEKAGVKVKQMLSLMKGRGDTTDPAGSPAPNVALGTRRLKILDQENAFQPFWSFDHRFLVVLNGEIYNFRELRKDIEKKGISFSTDSDTEVLAHGLAIYGSNFVKSFNGMFAFVAYDVKKKVFIAARDQLGIKPLYYVKNEDGICFASEIKPLLAVTDKGQIETLGPGCIFTSKGIYSYRPIVSPIKVGNLEQNTILLNEMLHRSVQSQLPVDLDCAVKFSGGIDSTLILHFAKKYKPDIHAYHISREDGRDRRYAEEYAEKTGINLHQVEYTREDVLGTLITVVQSVETFEPNIVRNACFSYLLSQKIHEDGIKVALCGEGADELFCGYTEMLENPKPLQTRERFIADLHKTQLQRVDRCSMQFELETRVPFLDAEIIRFAGLLPKAHLLGILEGKQMEKIILRKLYELDNSLPASIRTRSKVVFVDGAGMGDNSQSGPFYEYAQIMLSEKDYLDGLKRFSKFCPATKEEVYYLTILEKSFQLDRLNILAKRPIVNKNSSKIK